MTPRNITNSPQHKAGFTPLSDVAAPYARRTIETPLFHITSIQNTPHVCDIVVTTKGDSTHPTILTFEDVTKKCAKGILYILSNPGGSMISPRDPAPAVTRLNKAMAYAETCQISTSTLAGGKGYDAIATLFDETIKKLSSSDIAKLTTLEGLGGGIYHLAFPSQALMTASLLRMQEHFESPRFRGECFSREEFRSWYRTTRDHQEFSYYSDWMGFNFPGALLAPFIEGRFGELTNAENAVVDPFRGMKARFYIIGTTETDTPATLRHEIAHGLYHNNPSYRREVNKILASVDCAPIHKLLKSLGYHAAQWRDETHAYLGDPLSELESHEINTAAFTKVHFELLKIYDRYAVGLRNIKMPHDLR